MTKYFIELTDAVEYEVEAKGKEEAITQALEWWIERIPNIKTTIIEEANNILDFEGHE